MTDTQSPPASPIEVPVPAPEPRRSGGGFTRDLVRAFRTDHFALGGAIILLVALVVAVGAEALAPHLPNHMNRDPDTNVVMALRSPTTQFWLGTDNLGRDVLSRVIYGTRSALVVGLVSAALTTALGAMIGLVAGYVGRRTDAFLMRAVDAAYAIPFEPFVILVLALIGPSLMTIVLAMTMIMWRQPARVVRAQVLSLRELPFVKAARVSGASNSRILMLHIAPNVVPTMLTYAAISVGWAIIAEASISFLGFGDPRMLSWGSMLQSAFVTGAIRDAWWWTVSPGAAITITVLSFFFMTRALQTATSTGAGR